MGLGGRRLEAARLRRYIAALDREESAARIYAGLKGTSATSPSSASPTSSLTSR